MISSIIIQFDRQPHEFQPLETITGTFRLVDVDLEEVSQIEFSTLWFTEGKGDEDLGIVFFTELDRMNGLLRKMPERAVNEEDAAGRMTVQAQPEGNYVLPNQEEADGRSFRFSVKLPASPLSYLGKILKIHWCVRVRLFRKNGREVKSERMFQVGKVPQVQVDLN
ncbi:MAG: hypothetical protein E7028_02795 [Planctomycetaceae bacterium]|nr:hypothetical protein [Planctomycetaceae bacterium]MBQ2820875.1 hypothetical protein [Thermoguttaceae bacterium]MDO4424357.1 hypothetical protein [Planctomycetia bacterium]